MISDEGQRHAAELMNQAAETNLRAANFMYDCTGRLERLLGCGYGNNVEALIEELKKLNNPIIKTSNDQTHIYHKPASRTGREAGHRD